MMSKFLIKLQKKLYIRPSRLDWKISRRSSSHARSLMSFWKTWLAGWLATTADGIERMLSPDYV